LQSGTSEQTVPEMRVVDISYEEDRMED